MFLPTRVFVSTLTPSGVDQEVWLPHAGYPAGLMVNIQPATAELTAISDGEVFKTYRIFTTDSGINETMRLTVSGTGEQYTIRGRESYNYGVDVHYELTAARHET